MNTLQVVCPHGKVLREVPLDNSIRRDDLLIDLYEVIPCECNCKPKLCEACTLAEELKVATSRPVLAWLLKHHCKCGGAK